MSRRLAAALPAVLMVAALTSPRPSPAAAQEPGRRLTLLAQSPWVAPGRTAQFQLAIGPGAPADDLAVTLVVHQRLASRSGFDATFDTNPRLGSPIDLYTASLGAVPSTPTDVPVAVDIQDPGRRRDRTGLVLPREGVYPVEVQLKDGTDVILDTFTTYLVNAPGGMAPQRLGVVLVVPFHASPGLNPAGARSVEEGERLFSIARALESSRDVPVVVAPTPETVESLAASSDTPALETLGVLRQAVGPGTRHQTVPTTYVPVSFPELVAAGLGIEADTQIETGLRVVQNTLRPSPPAPADDRGRAVTPAPENPSGPTGPGPAEPTLTWLSDETVDDKTLGGLLRNGVGRIVVPESALVPIDLPTTLARPFQLDVTDSPFKFAAAPGDRGLARHFTEAAEPVLRAHRLLADLAVLFFDQPAGVRGVVALPPRDGDMAPELLREVLRALRDHPLLAPMTVDTFFDDVKPALDRRNAPLERQLAVKREGGGDFDDAALTIRRLRRELADLATVLDPAHPLRQTLGRRLLISQSSELSAGQRRAYIRGVEADLRAQRRGIRVPSRPQLTLTSREGQIPVTLRNRTGHPVCVQVALESEKLTFARQRAPTPPGPDAAPGPDDWCPAHVGGSSTSVWRQLRLDRPNTTLRFAVVAKTSGAFPVRAELWGPPPPGEGGRPSSEAADALLIQNARFTVRSTAASWVGLVLSIGAGMFLALWWGRHIVRGRRARRLIPT